MRWCSGSRALTPSRWRGWPAPAPIRCTSSFRPSYNMAVNLVGWAGRQRAAALLESSFAQFQADRAVVGIARQARRARQSMERGRRQLPAGRLRRVRGAPPRAVPARGRPVAAALSGPAGRRPALAGAAAAAATSSGSRAAGGPGSPWCSTTARTATTSPLPLVLTAGHQVKRLSVTDFPVPVDAHRPDPDTQRGSALGRPSTAGTSPPPCATKSPGVTWASCRGRAGAAAGEDEDIANLRRRLRQHPCHSCPDREQHARQAEKQLRLEREAEALERRVAGRSHVIARTFDRVCARPRTAGLRPRRRRDRRGQAARRPLHRARPAGRRIAPAGPVGRPGAR